MLTWSPEKYAATPGEDWEDPQAPLRARAWSFFCAFLARFGAFLGGELFHISVFPFLFWNIDQALGRYVCVCGSLVIFLVFGSCHVMGARTHAIAHCCSHFSSRLRVARRVVYLWVMSMYVGQGAKDHMRLPRPAVRLRVSR